MFQLTNAEFEELKAKLDIPKLNFKFGWNQKIAVRFHSREYRYAVWLTEVGGCR